MAITDKFSSVGEPGSATYLANPGYSMGGTSINIQTYVGWPTGKIIFDMYTTKLVGNEEKAADNTRTSWQGIHNGSGTITSLQKLSGNDQNYTAGTGTRVIITHSTHWANQLVDGITTHANQDGSLKTAAVQSALNLGTQDLNGWNPLGYTATFLQNNGNKETVVNYNGDVTNILSPGMKVAYTRSVAPPTKCMAFQASSSQYATKASPAGITGTSAITLEALIYVNSYSEGGIVSATNATTSGFQFQIKPTGQLQIVAIQSSGVARNRITNQTIPLKKWVHVAVAVTMSTGVITFFVNGAPVAHSSADAGSATAITQGGPLQLGAVNSSWFLDGLTAETRLWSTARTQAEILANMNNNLTGSESGLVGLWRGENNFNDLTANANHLTATNGAIATQNANPFNLIEYGIITKVGAFSGGVTPVTISTGDMCNIPNMALSSPLYSTMDNPFGLPGDLRSVGRRLVFIPVTAQQSTTANTAVQFNPVTNVSFTVPMNCTAIKLYLFNTSLNAGPGNTLVFKFYNGSVASGTDLMQINNTTTNGYISACGVVPVVPGETINLNCGWSATGGTSIWSSGGGRQTPAIWVETA